MQSIHVSEQEQSSLELMGVHSEKIRERERVVADSCQFVVSSGLDQ